ncbi:MAG: class II aldolase/adducin family protein [Planctomycetes bacterium]|nr:class II aldolase/adducin family protein [Planctomycetota bacterium]
MDIRPRTTYNSAKTVNPQSAGKKGATSKAVSLGELDSIKEQICDIGRRIYNKGFAAGNDGNISYRLGENEVLCTPTLICKGFINPDDLCTVDLEGNQLSGWRKCTSEVRLHLAIMKERSDVKSVVHCHPPHATAFAVAREAIPQCVLPEIEVFLGDVPITQYKTPGNWDFANTILPFVHKANIAILANHGTVSWGETVEKAYWSTEILDAYCRILMLARDLGNIAYFNESEERELLALKQKWGFADPRNTPEMKNCDICANDVFRDSWNTSGVAQRVFAPPPPMRPGTSAPAVDDTEKLVKEITDRVMAALAK